VSQGTILDFIYYIYILYINELFNQYTHGKVICFSDDTVILLRNHDLNELYKINEDSFWLLKLGYRQNNNLLKINIII
jgi:hypothetical protein